MKKVYTIFIIFFAVTISVAAYGQTQYESFLIKERELIWQHIYDTAINYSDVEKFLKTAPTIKNIQNSDSSLICDVVNLKVDLNKYGRTWGNTAILFQYGIGGKLKLDWKKDRYRVTFYGLKVVSQQPDDFSSYTLKGSRDSIRPIWAKPNMLGLYHMYFRDYFKIRKIDSEW